MYEADQEADNHTTTSYTTPSEHCLQPLTRPGNGLRPPSLTISHICQIWDPNELVTKLISCSYDCTTITLFINIKKKTTKNTFKKILNWIPNRKPLQISSNDTAKSVHNNILEKTTLPRTFFYHILLSIHNSWYNNIAL